MTVNKKIKLLRTKKQLSTIEFSNIIGISNKKLETIENNELKVDKRIVKRISKQFNMSYKVLKGKKTNKLLPILIVGVIVIAIITGLSIIMNYLLQAQGLSLLKMIY